jgi:hypothetical protein
MRRIVVQTHPPIDLQPDVQAARLDEPAGLFDFGIGRFDEGLTAEAGIK